MSSYKDLEDVLLKNFEYIHCEHGRNIQRRTYKHNKFEACISVEPDGEYKIIHVYNEYKTIGYIKHGDSFRTMEEDDVQEFKQLIDSLALKEVLQEELVKNTAIKTKTNKL